MGEVSEWFWLAIEQTWLDLDRLATWLETASREEIEDFAREFRRAKERVVADYSNGIDVDGVIFCWSVAGSQRSMC